MVQFQKCDMLDVESIEVDPKTLEGLQRIFDLQKSFGSRFVDFENQSIEYKTKWTKEFIVHIASENTELLEQLPFKHWKDYSEMKVNLREVQFELIDQLHFLITICLLWGIDAKLMYQLYIAKNKHNIQRQEDPSLGYVKHGTQESNGTTQTQEGTGEAQK